ncbi:unnamed protein product [Lactuca virosa]|uniref:Uncharacterized protein n=1 Tax=Lactuca virosa TaxID=75947 RepID=A0AAU9P2Z7_9ASTR|nr:unnamed protein product [Lactuca virosa]
METLAGREVTLLERLHMKRLVSSTLIMKESTLPNSLSWSESSMDSTMNPSVLETTASVAPFPKKIMQTEPDNSKPMTSSTRVDLRCLCSKRKVRVEKILSLEGVMSHLDQVINLSPPKKISTRGSDTKGRGQFQCPFAITSIPKGHELANSSDEESIDRARSCLMVGIHPLNEVSCHTRQRANILVGQQSKFEEAF